MERPVRFEHHRWVGDKRRQIVFDVDAMIDTTIIDGLMAAGTYICFAPDTLAEARNRGYRPFNGTGSDGGDPHVVSDYLDAVAVD